MPREQSGAVLRRLRQLLHPSESGDVPDSALLERFRLEHDEAAFSELVRRHGALVLGVCRRVLQDAHAADDAFQATFLVLVRKAGAIRQGATLGSWLYTVAYRVARHARAQAARRLAREREVPVMSASEPVNEEFLAILDEELNRLPERYRAPVVLCYLEGKTNDEAARLLGWTVWSLKSRLVRARNLLHKRLTRRKLAFSVAGLTALAAENNVSAALAEQTVHSAVLTASGQLVAAPVAALTEGALQAMWYAKLKNIVLLLAVCVTVAGSGLLAQQLLAAKPAELQAKAAAPAAAAAQPADDAKGIAAVEFERLHKEVRPRPGEALWAEIPWTYDLHKARQKAAAEGKPLCVWRMAGDPTAVC